MKKIIWKVVVIVLLITSVASIARAEDATPPLDLHASVDVPVSCEVTDTDGGAHSYTAPSPDSYLAICTLDAALQNGDITSVGLSNAFPDLGLFVVSINDTSADPSSQYWALFQNGGFASLGLSSLPVAALDEIKLDLQDFSGTSLGYSLTIVINSLVPVIPPEPEENQGHHHSSSGSTRTETPGVVLGAETKAEFDLKKAFDFLASQQKEDGSFGGDLYTDWIAMALATSNNGEKVIKLIKHFGESKIAGNVLTDYERHAMALMALGLNPYSSNGENYIKKITDAFDGKQFGDVNEDNDDIFALIVLQNAGFSASEKNISSSIEFVLSRQKENGSWDESIDMTGAAIQALAFYMSDEQNKNTTEKALGRSPMGEAKDFLKKNQKDNGGWSNASSTAWAMGGILALGEKPEDWKVGKDEAINTPLDYLATLQDTDGGVKNENIQNKIWETAYVASALSGKTWNQIMQKFEKPKTQGQSLENSQRTVLKNPKIAKKITPTISKQTELENPPITNTSEEENTPPPEPKKENWFMRFMHFIF